MHMAVCFSRHFLCLFRRGDMAIFQYTWRQVLDGSKTETRRIKSLADDYWSVNNDVLCIVRNRRIKWQVGKTYAVQPGRGKRAGWCRQMPGELQTIYDADCP